ncbi:GNAT family N-acetyltransferase [Nesterenkonia sp. HG001]|uniref:GNAT family N-acetyltransferase n=1 Tax=Nesterenkonia sp. HG001 TaxID=2983207 RepID=UPI002AC4A181|nr:GNAT family N-acetyltransferase [Nesterenkonia sp. HG001]MDZ5076101.1 GNAT family N-acetyltransferase [Nesterenkonia sp. HG001]
MDFQISSVTSPSRQRKVHALAHQHITGYGSPSHVKRERATYERDLRTAFSGESVPEGDFIGTVASDSGDLIGGVIIEHCAPRPLLRSSPETGRLYAQHHRNLSGMFVVPEYQGQGIASLLLETAYQVVREQGARYIEGFVDIRHPQAVRVYKHAGFTVTPLNQGLPPREPTQFTIHHPSGINGYWFYRDLYQ